MNSYCESLYALKNIVEKNNHLFQMEVFDPTELERNQIGYSISPAGKSLIDGSEYSWENSWLAVGTDSLTGDPLVLDTEDMSLGFVCHDPAWTAGDSFDGSIFDVVDNLLQISTLAESVLDSDGGIRSYNNFESLLLILQKLLNGETYNSTAYDHALKPLKEIVDHCKGKLVLKAKALKSEGMKISDISIELGISTKFVYKIFK